MPKPGAKLTPASLADQRVHNGFARETLVGAARAEKMAAGIVTSDEWYAAGVRGTVILNVFHDVRLVRPDNLDLVKREIADLMNLVEIDVENVVAGDADDFPILGGSWRG